MHGNGQRGFSLVVVFLILSLMAAAALAVLVTARSDIRVSGHERLRSVAFYAAEAGLAYAKADLTTRWSPSSLWTPVLSNSAYRRGITRDYRFGGSNGVPIIRARYTYRVQNNPDDPSGSPTVDTDGKVVLVAVGQALDPSGRRVLATVTLQSEVLWMEAGQGTTNYQAQPNQDVSGSLNSHPDVQAVDMSRWRRL